MTDKPQAIWTHDAMNQAEIMLTVGYLDGEKHLAVFVDGREQPYLIDADAVIEALTLTHEGDE